MKRINCTIEIDMRGKDIKETNPVNGLGSKVVQRGGENEDKGSHYWQHKAQRTKVRAKE